MAEVDFFRLETARKTLWTPTNLSDFKSSVVYLRTHISPIFRNRIDIITQDSETVQTTLVSFKSDDGRPLSRAMRAATYIRRHPITELYETAQTFLDQDKKGDFVLWYDLAHYARDSAMSIERAEGVFRRGARAETVHAFGSQLPSETELESASIRFERYNQILIDNRSGQHVMDYQAVRHLEEVFGLTIVDHSLEEGYPLAIYTFAALYASSLYKAVYPLTKTP